MRSVRSLSAVALALALVGCGGSMQVQHETTTSASGHSTYAWVTHEIARHPDVDAVAQTRVDAAMEQRGFTKVEPADADLILTVKVLIHATEAGMPDNPAAGASADIAAGLEGSSQDREHDKIIVVFLQDRRSHEIVWLGWSRAQVAESRIGALALEALPALLAELPVARR